MSPPRQKPGKSVQVVETPDDLILQVEQRFGKIKFDLAANPNNRKAARYFGREGEAEDALVVPWPRGILCWLNPPFGLCEEFARKCAEESEQGTRVLLLTPASVGANWFNSYVRPHAYVLELAPRVTFVGHPTPYPKDLIVSYFGPERLTGRRAWRWK